MADRQAGSQGMQAGRLACRQPRVGESVTDLGLGAKKSWERGSRL